MKEHRKKHDKANGPTMAMSGLLAFLSEPRKDRLIVAFPPVRGLGPLHSDL